MAFLFAHRKGWSNNESRSVYNSWEIVCKGLWSISIKASAFLSALSYRSWDHKENLQVLIGKFFRQIVQQRYLMFYTYYLFHANFNKLFLVFWIFMRIHFLLFSSKKMWLPLVLFLIVGNFQTLTGKLDEIYLVQSKLKGQLLWYN